MSINDSEQNGVQKQKMSTAGKWFWRVFFLLIIASAIMKIMFSSSITKTTVGESSISNKNGKNDMVNIIEDRIDGLRMVIGGKEYIVEKEIYEKAKNDTRKILHNIGVELKKEAANKASVMILSAFGKCDKNIKDFSDWYYGLTSSYEQMYSVVKGDADKLIQEKLEKYVIEPCNVSLNIENGAKDIDTFLISRLNEISTEVSRSTKEFVARNNIDYKNKDELHSIEFDKMLANNVNKISTEYGLKMVGNQLEKNATAFAVLFSANIAYKYSSAHIVSLIATSTSFKVITGSIVKALASAGAKTGGKAAITVSGASEGLVLCAPTGPWAAICGIVGGAIAWFAADAAVNIIDEVINRDDFIKNVNNSLNDASLEITNQLNIESEQFIDDFINALSKI